MTEILKTVYNSDEDFIKASMGLYKIKNFSLDPTYSKGNFYKNIKDPEIVGDINPQDNVLKMDSRDTGLPSNSVTSIVFDPPFLAGSRGTGKISSRFSSCNSFKELWDLYFDSLLEFHRILAQSGLVFFKCQDCCNARKQYFSHVEIYNMATQLGFYARDLGIVLSKAQMKPYNFKNQQHFRKSHCYWWVFQKLSKSNESHDFWPGK